jgi:hypothetical protein
MAGVSSGGGLRRLVFTSEDHIKPYLGLGITMDHAIVQDDTPVLLRWRAKNVENLAARAKLVRTIPA